MIGAEPLVPRHFRIAVVALVIAVMKPVQADKSIEQLLQKPLIHILGFQHM
ncbi:hypothetical protein RUE5091_02842 [Ruegeria denitrificans]|uniref:Uncharacterized protein n=1 Tax=Ruegeria denitrificans TaxID=1715692 RepID=A0A0P1IDB4_9RHOB|nr:hypothetical protein RUE5091_02842 [Ruegeria denitrificans]